MNLLESREMKIHKTRPLTLDDFLVNVYAYKIDISLCRISKVFHFNPPTFEIIDTSGREIKDLHIYYNLQNVVRVDNDGEEHFDLYSTQSFLDKQLFNPYIFIDFMTSFFV
jgi:hypothetical protein